MAPPAAASEDQRDGKGRRRRRPDCVGAGARILSLTVQAAVMAVALALFLFFATATAILLLHLVVTAQAFRNQQHGRSRYRGVPERAVARASHRDHAFHAASVDRWLARAAACLVCRAAVSVSMS
ncbi:hypothetical protein E2562_020112 [Oryza meyeriana var. granulata]|uniref:Uncharacterized protein n=1 Tax=Oryza meyeriana var. granulata TaxID=110450 RepID=A0A6G1EAP5_9ORYZ|nr:hypothetical protein E2562_020112 [Oryza meyeriana var. granulata]